MQLEALRQEIIAHPLLARPSLTSKLAVNRPSTSPPSPPPNPARPSFLRRAALYGSCGCDSLPVRSTRRSKTPVCLSRRPSQCVSSSQQPTANSQHRRLPSTATHRQPSPKTQHHSILTAPHIATVSASQKGLPSCPCLEIAFAPQTLGFVAVPYPNPVLSCLPAGCALCFVISHPQPATPACFLSPRQFPGRLVPPRSISYSAPRLHFLPATILSCDKVQLCDFGIFTPPQSGRLRCDSASCLFSPRLRRNTS
jgi:hypothetical protein